MGQSARKKTATEQKPRSGPAKQIAVIASGPSARKEDAEKLAGICEEVIVVNDAWRLLPNANHLYGCDYRWWRYHIADVSRDFEGQCWTQDVQWHEKGKAVDPAQWGIKQLKSVAEPGLSREWGTLHQGQNSGYQAVNLAYLFGATRIFLLGFDMGHDGKLKHFFGDHPADMNVASCYPDFVRRFRTIIPAEYGIEIINCSRVSALDAFPKVELEKCLELFSAPAQASESQRAA